jgi:predicted esterase/catechol 2,3-dioxygenase-like lactoylglutathione lyase family enzyme
MNATPRTTGIHHITAVASSAARNLAFYEEVLGLRLVKQTVNFDDPYTYHLYYGDTGGGPGTLLTFFPWEGLPRGRSGAGMVTAVGFAIPRAGLGFWEGRLAALGIPAETGERFGDPVLRLTDSHGLPIELIAAEGVPETRPWAGGPVEARYAVTGLHSATATVRELEPTRDLLTRAMGMTPTGREGGRHRFAAAPSGAPGRFYDLVVDPDAAPGRPGAGTVHHIAFRAEDDDAQGRWRSVLSDSGMDVSPVRDRNYFRSIYFRAPDGVLFEIATDPPGFSVDESVESLGGSLRLPSRYEPLREDIERRLPRLRPPAFRHVFQAPEGDADDGRTVAALHGTGGDERDLLDTAARLFPASAVLSPRGRVLENGMARYFRRLSVNVFDEDDVVRRAHELADFLAAAAMRNGRNSGRLTALGYSNGANIAAAVLLVRPEAFAGAVLVRPMLPLQSPPLPDLHGKPVLILKGLRDRVIPPESTDRLAAVLERAGASVTVAGIDAGHAVSAEDLGAIDAWRRSPGLEHSVPGVRPGPLRKTA